MKYIVFLSFFFAFCLPVTFRIIFKIFDIHYKHVLMRMLLVLIYFDICQLLYLSYFWSDFHEFRENFTFYSFKFLILAQVSAFFFTVLYHQKNVCR